GMKRRRTLDHRRLHLTKVDQQIVGRSSTDGTEGGLATNLEEKPQPPAKVPSGTAAGSNSHQNPLDESPLAKAGNVSSKQPPSSRST
ncbi:hypothetical protein F441_00792, partial [Phytophthora nicotianae CJ01A1]